VEGREREGPVRKRRKGKNEIGLNGRRWEKVKAPEEELRRLWRVEFLQLEVAIGAAVNCSSRRWHGWGNSGELQSGETEQRQRRKTKGIS
jgi:hypothetical protein